MLRSYWSQESIFHDSGAVDLQEQKILDIEELLELCIRTEECCSGFKKFEFFQIVDATDNFSESRYVGWGGFATVYKVIITQNRKELTE